MKKPYKDLLLLVDTSGSMEPLQEAIKLGAKYAFDVGQEDELNRRYAVITFSEATRTSKWISKTESERLEERLEDLLGTPYTGGSEISMNLLRRMDEGRYAMLMITDIGIGNVGDLFELREFFRNSVEKGNRVGAIFMGGASPSMEAMKEFADVYELPSKPTFKTQYNLVGLMEKYARFVLRGERKP